MAASETMDVTANNDSVVDIAAQAILHGIKAGHYAPGQRLIEAELIKRFSISRTALREAFLRLQGDGLVQIERHRGAIVRHLSKDELRWTFAVRRELEGLAAALAAPVLAADPTELCRLCDIAAEAARKSDMQSFSTANDAFHKLIRTASGNPVLDQAAQRLGNTILLAQFRGPLEQEMMSGSLAEHDAMVQTLLTGDAAAARVAAEAHVDASLQRFLSLPNGFFATP